MVSSTLTAAVALLSAPLVSSHYILNILMHNGAAVGGEYAYVRKNSNTYMPSFFEIIDTNELRCNKGAVAGSTATYQDVQAGDKIGLKLFNSEFIEHPGPGFFYMSKAPGNVSDYDGSGDWFKVWESGPTGSPTTTGAWPTYGKYTMEFTLPTTLEDGEYLLRGEHIGIHENHVGKPQVNPSQPQPHVENCYYAQTTNLNLMNSSVSLYSHSHSHLIPIPIIPHATTQLTTPSPTPDMECAQIRITGGTGTAQPSPLVKIPGIYSRTDPGLTYNFWGSGGTYTMPGPAVAKS
ncbi:Uu.00g012340.m01.CDS01 [Anthostomella pinea]|uniref:lytic cellulose monooxygenase (C4-dehydrogenating) n=1 Tax=Anthostomella pinea TaxID=933095 RepID=A0AAI8YQ80_9PEZI|nr:Uu.00g012340.m01.CDS01 [Anthostomella pinea]